MKKINLLDILGLVDNQMLNRAIETDSAEKLKELKKLEKRRKYFGLFRYVSMFAGGLAVLVVGIVLLNNNINDDNVLISNPMIEVKDISELEKYIKLDLSKYEIKKINEMYKFDNENLIQIKYADGSTLRIGKESTDNIGIYGATLEKSEKINGVNVSIYKVDNIIYAIWDDDNYSFSYIFNDNDDIALVLSKLV